MRITAFADRLLEGLDRIDWSTSLKETQRNWIGKSVGAAIFFDIDGHQGQIEVFSTRPDTLFGATFVTLAPEHELVQKITTADQREAVKPTKPRLQHAANATVWRIQKQSAVVSLAPMPCTQSAVLRCLFGLAIMYWRAMGQVP